MRNAPNVKGVLHFAYIKNICYNAGMARPVKHPIKKVVGFDAALLERVREFRFEKRIASENEAIRQLIEAGLNVGAKSSPASRGKQSGQSDHTAASPPRKPRAKPLAMSKEAQIRALRERETR
jgi:hypothetical protein